MLVGTVILEKNDGKRDLYRATMQSEDKRINGLEGVSGYSMANAIEDLALEVEKAQE